MIEFGEICERAARAGGHVLLNYRSRFRVREKAPRDLVTDADLAAQRAIRDILLGAFPDHDFLGEEEDPSVTKRGRSVAADGRPRWIVDPLDGTANYVHGLQGFAVSIAVERQGQLLAGTVFDPLSGECFTARQGQGAWLNGRPLAVSDCKELGQAMVAASFSPDVERDSVEIRRFVDVLVACQSIRRLGSCALNLSYVAAGRLDGYWTTSVKTWDVAAGALLVAEAGGLTTNLQGGQLDLNRPEFVSASTPQLHAALLGILRPGT
jgi:myo-inositol-1(or 4)-monophosphatase